MSWFNNAQDLAHRPGGMGTGARPRFSTSSGPVGPPPQLPGAPSGPSPGSPPGPPMGAPVGDPMQPMARNANPGGGPFNVPNGMDAELWAQSQWMQEAMQDPYIRAMMEQRKRQGWMRMLGLGGGARMLGGGAGGAGSMRSSSTPGMSSALAMLLANGGGGCGPGGCGGG